LYIGKSRALFFSTKSKEEILPQFNWHTDTIDRATRVTESYKSSQRGRRFLITQCGADFKFDRGFMAWIKDGNPEVMGDVADEWTRRHISKTSFGRGG
jgi:hypothetical protein